MQLLLGSPLGNSYNTVKMSIILENASLTNYLKRINAEEQTEYTK